jgi:hypothetical protein
MNRERKVHYQDVRRTSRARDRSKVVERIVREFIKAGIDAEGTADEQHGVTVWRGLHRQLRAYDSTGAGAVVDDELLTQALAELVRNQARHEIRIAAGSLRDDEAHGTLGIIRLAWVSLGSARAGGRRRERQGKYEWGMLGHRLFSLVAE